MTEKLVLSVAEVSIELGISRPTVYKLIKTPGFPAMRLGVGRIVIPRDALREWLNNNCENKNGMTECPEE